MGIDSKSSNGLATLFIRVFTKSGFNSHENNGKVLFESKILRGEVTLTKPFSVKWKAKNGYVVMDLPRSNGDSSVYFSNVSDCLDFLRRRILHK